VGGFEFCRADAAKELFDDLVFVDRQVEGEPNPLVG
jgi:hypothetical protein